jgi:NAD(P)-dependent dehydrogenase (short-subunit alcohol dehydrogenase family)
MTAPTDQAVEPLPRVALVTGAASGIGAAVARRLAAGYVVFAHDRDADALAATAGEIEAAGGTVMTRVGDLTSADECRAAVADCVERARRLDVLANVAGVALFAHVGAMSEEQYRRVMAVNTDAVLFLSQAALPHLLASSGCIVNLASTAGLSGVAYNAAYCMSKGAVVALTRSMAVELTHTTVRVNAIAPGAVDTPMIQQLTIPDDVDVELVLRSAAPGRAAAAPEQVAELVAFLASPAASAMNGAIVTMDGGATAG